MYGCVQKSDAVAHQKESLSSIQLENKIVPANSIVAFIQLIMCCFLNKDI